MNSDFNGIHLSDFVDHAGSDGYSIFDYKFNPNIKVNYSVDELQYRYEHYLTYLFMQFEDSVDNNNKKLTKEIRLLIEGAIAFGKDALGLHYDEDLQDDLINRAIVQRKERDNNND